MNAFASRGLPLSLGFLSALHDVLGITVGARADL